VHEKFPNILRRVGASPNNDVGWAAAPASEKAAKSFGIETVAPQEYIDISGVEFSSLLLKLLKAKPDIIDCATAPGRVFALLVKQARELGYTGRVINVGIGDPDVMLDRQTRR
jgi:branched-chain amino acid transport system substrate-binding protein